LAACHLSLNDPLSARDVLIDYARSHPRDGAAQLLLAKAAMATDDLVTATRAIDLAERWGSSHSDIGFVRAAIQWRWGNTDEALDTLDDLLEANPHDVDAQCLRGEVLASQQRVEESANAFYRALQIDPTNSWAAAGLAEMEAAETAATQGTLATPAIAPSYQPHR
jgi:predicted Zn-dependent protease